MAFGDVENFLGQFDANGDKGLSEAEIFRLVGDVVLALPTIEPWDVFDGLEKSFRPSFAAADADKSGAIDKHEAMGFLGHLFLGVLDHVSLKDSV